MRNQINNVLPKSAWDKVIIKETGEKLVEVREGEYLKIGLVTKGYFPSFLVRKTVAEKLHKAAAQLPEEFNLVLIEGYRTLESQKESWDRKFQKLKDENPTWSDEEIEAKVRLVVARPSSLANHHCGGAVDVTICYKNGELLDMGTSYPSEAMGAEWYEKFKMHSDEINEDQKENRKILMNAMESQDFVWYPGEWWHYCWGDRMWAVYSNQTECFYGPIEK